MTVRLVSWNKEACIDACMYALPSCMISKRVNNEEKKNKAKNKLTDINMHDVYSLI